MHYDIAIVGEAYGEQEAAEGRPFVGRSGWFLRQQLSQVGIRFEDCFVTNVLNFRPPGNDLDQLTGPKALAIPGYGPIAKGKYLNAQYTPELARLYTELNAATPNVIIALGATATWALTGSAGIKGLRGSVTQCKPHGLAATGVALAPWKILPTFHPANILREYTNRPIQLSDLAKAAAQSAFPEVRRTSREIWLEPDLGDLLRFERMHILPATQLSIDVETKGDQITCIGFAPSSVVSITIPFWSARQRDGNYWRTLREEVAAWNFVRRWCAAKPSLFQNGMYDAHRIWRTYGIPITQMEDDTMLLHHALQPEMEKGLGFLGSVYTDEISWKLLRKVDTLKKED